MLFDAFCSAGPEISVIFPVYQEYGTFFYKSNRELTDPFLIELILFIRVHYRKREDTYLRIFFILQFFEK